MIRIIAGGKKNTRWAESACQEYEKRLRKPYDIKWEFYDEERLLQRLSDWPFGPMRHYVICCDERGQNISSDEYSQRLQSAFMDGREVIVLIGGAYGFNDEIRMKADFVWSFSRLVFPHALARLIATEQIYRASEIAKGSHYHHQ
ncbi:23S rRNA (pseudouridine(1915)-N(3))-methyltransferase RlmH [Candidatus Saccharibacteria bacterium]|nr:23S rRNA (pseudouridine(1915)-N(3))-methyltransferase RlmH [Candidatus Saccharibacteria bacterium]